MLVPAVATMSTVGTLREKRCEVGTHLDGSHPGASGNEALVAWPVPGPTSTTTGDRGSAAWPPADAICRERVDQEHLTVQSVGETTNEVSKFLFVAQ